MKKKSDNKKTFSLLSVVVHACNSSYMGGGSRRIEVQASPRQKQETLSKK
jgi:hypothetical protein